MDILIGTTTFKDTLFTVIYDSGGDGKNNLAVFAKNKKTGADIGGEYFSNDYLLGLPAMFTTQDVMRLANKLNVDNYIIDCCKGYARFRKWEPIDEECDDK